jgi:pilus assembly protein CpaB
MRWNSLVMLAIAVICGGLGVYFANQWLELQAQQIGRQEVPRPAEAESTIVVAAANLTFGNEITPEVLREIPWPADSLPEGSFAQISDLTDKGRRVVLLTMGPNEPILNWKITGPNERATLSSLVSDGMRAVGIRVNDVAGVGGFILPGDRVDVMFIKTDTANDQRPTTDVIIQNARVLAVDQVADEKATQAVVAKVVTIEVSSLDAQKVALAQTVGTLSLSLRASGSMDNKPGRRVVVEELTSSPNEYVAEFNARKAEQEALDARLKDLEKSLTSLDGRIDERAKANQEALAQRFKDLQTTLAELDKRIDVGGKGEDALRQKLARVENSLQEVSKQADSQDAENKKTIAALRDTLRQSIQAAGEGDSKLKTELTTLQNRLLQVAQSGDAKTREQLATLEQNIRKTLLSAGQDDKKLRDKLGTFEAALRKAIDFAGSGDSALKTRLAELERSLRDVNNKLISPPEVKIEPAVALEAAPVVNDKLMINVTKGIKRESIEVPRDVLSQ